MRTLALVLLVLAAALTVTGQSATAQSARPQSVSTPARPADASRVLLRGVVTDAGNGAALRNARITVTLAPPRTLVVTTDGNGAFRMRVPSEAPLSVRVTKAGYVPPTVRLSLADLRSGAPLDVRLTRAAVITGRVLDASGEPPTNIMALTLWGVGPSGSWGAGVPVSRESIVSIVPDDRGEFRLGGLPPGRYVIEGVASTLSGGYRVSPAAVDLQPGVETALNLVFERGGDPVPLVITTSSTGSGMVITQVGPFVPPPTNAGQSIRGRVVTTEGAPVADVVVSATRNGTGRNAQTDALGRFTLTGLLPGPHTIFAARRGYVRTEHGQRGDDLPGAPVVVEADRDVADITIEMPRAGVVTGAVVDEHGEPIQDAAIQLLRVRSSPTGLVAVREQGAFSVQSDDRGQFRLSNAAPGEYVLSSSLPMETAEGLTGPRTAYVPIYYPATTDFVDAAPLRIGRAEEIHGLFLTMRRVPVARVSGIARNAADTPFSGTVRLTPRHASAVAVEARVVHPEPSGEFAFDNVGAGDYVLQALAGSGSSGPEFASSPVSIVDRDPEPIVLRTAPGSRIDGRFVLEGDGGALMWGYSASAVPQAGAWTPGTVSNLGSPVATGEAFSMSGLAGLTRLRLSSEDENWYLKSVTIDGFDAADRVFDFGFAGRSYTDVEVVFSRLGASVTGSATDDRARPVRDYAVYVFTIDRDGWFRDSRRVKLTRAGPDGTFRVRSMPPGDYWVAAVGRVDPSQRAGDWDPDLFDTLAARATRVTLGEGEARQVTLRLQ